MKITQSKLLNIGFCKTEGTSYPLYYKHKDLEEYFIGQDGEGWWGLYQKHIDRDPNCIESLDNMLSLISAMLRKAIENGKEIRSKEIKKLIG